MKKIGIISNNKLKNKIIEDINICNYLNEHGCFAEIISWEDTSIDFTKYDALLLRSVWGYQNNYTNFVKWLDFLLEKSL